MNPPEDFEVIHAMRYFGGSFVNALAWAAMRADPENLRRLKEAWPEYWKKYSEMAAMEAAKEAVA